MDTEHSFLRESPDSLKTTTSDSDALHEKKTCGFSVNDFSLSECVLAKENVRQRNGLVAYGVAQAGAC